MRTRSIVGILLMALTASIWAPAQAEVPIVPGCKSDKDVIDVDSCFKLSGELQLPNLVPHVPFYVIVPVPGVLGFTTVVANRGNYSLDLLAQLNADLELTRAHQCISWVERVCLARRDAGEFVFHPEHGHWHFNDFALYELRKLTRRGVPNMKKGGLIATSGKVSFCLIDYRRDQYSDESLDPEELSDPAFYNECVGINQGISPGWADVYDAWLAGQNLPITGLADGRYALVYTIDPDNRLPETDDDDNTSWATIEIYGAGTGAKVVP